jgi:hypothetical protein
MSEHDESARLARRHHRLGWGALLVFACSGMVLETLLGFRVPWLVDVDVETRRTMFRLAHAHGALLGMMNAVLAASLRSGGALGLLHARRSSALLVFGTVAIPLGFVLGGVWFYDGDPGLGVVLVPTGGLALVAGLFDVARG